MKSMEKTPADSSKHLVSDEDVKFAIFRGREGITDAMYEEVLNFAEYVYWREGAKISPRQCALSDADIRTAIQKLIHAKGSDYVEGFITGINQAPIKSR